MPRILEPLLLPQLVKARRSLEQSEIVDGEGVDWITSIPTRNSSVSDLSLPVTPTFSLRGHSRYGSSISSADATSPTLRTPTTSSSPTDALDDSYGGKRSLPDVKEEPVEREDADYDMMDDRSRRDEASTEHPRPHSPWATSAAPPPTPTRSPFDYDLAAGFVCESVSSDESRLRRRRQQRVGESPLASLALRLGDRLPSFSRRWRGRRLSRLSFNATDVVTGPAAHLASSRASSRTSSITGGLHRYATRETQTATPSPRTPLEPSNVDQPAEVVGSDPVDAEPELLDDRLQEVCDERQATTPLLPPLLIPDAPTSNAPESYIQSPLQSPTVANSPDTFSATGNCTPSLRSGRPSMSSMRGPTPGPQLPTHDIPPMRLADPDDEWSTRLGHANFDIHPEPYQPEVCDAEACRQLRANWEQARYNYIKHLVRTGEHYGVTSKTYRLTEEKWAEIDADWRRKHEETVSQAADNGALTASFVRRASPEPSAMTVLPSLNGPHSDGKFPQLGNDDIVGPMVQVQMHAARRKSTTKPSRRGIFCRFLPDLRWPPMSFLGFATRRKGTMS
ncbi:MAG: Ubiquitin-conjugating enzyme E2 4 [Watsoniomyces obsoletus]|nr:MAG: Ubiquitin-conjugating enzyme E2 4 [Watsoniomyces obsoletus]